MYKVIVKIGSGTWLAGEFYYHFRTDGEVFWRVVYQLSESSYLLHYSSLNQ